jgi:hypothetical protein
MPGRDPGLPDLRPYLEERPATYAALVERARIAQEWIGAATPSGGRTWSRWPLFLRVSVAGSLDELVPVCHISQESDGTWLACVLGQELDNAYSTAEEARHAADLRASNTYNWVLLGGAA